MVQELTNEEAYDAEEAGLVRQPLPCVRIRSHMQTLITDKPGLNQNFYTFTSISLLKIFLCSKLPSTYFINKDFEMRSKNQLPFRKTRTLISK